MALLVEIGPDSLIDEDESARMLIAADPAWKLCELLRDVEDRTKDARFALSRQARSSRASACA